MNLPKWWKDDGSRTYRNEQSKAQEISRANQTQGKRQAGSGSSRYARHDIKTEDILEEIKFTASGHYVIKANDWIRLRKNALIAGREPRLIVDFYCGERPNQEKFRLIVTEEQIPGNM
jgi:hypothetical protein